MAFLSTNALNIPTTATAAAPPRHHRHSLVVARATATAAKCSEHQQQEPAAKAAGGRRRAMVLLAAAVAAGTGSSAAICQQSARAAGVTTLSGQYVEIDKVKEDSYVQGVGEWAVGEHNRQTGESLQFAEVFRGMEQVVAGTNYKLDLATKDPTSSYRAVVFDPLPNSNQLRKLVSFTPI